MHDGICTEESARHLHLLGATSTPRSEMVDGREYLVVPVIALMESVIHASNSKNPEFVSAEVLTKAASSWLNKPLCVGHPKKNGTQCSANSPEVLESHGFGKIRDVVMKGKKLFMEALVDPLRLKALKQERLLADLREGKPISVSVGAYVTTNDKSSEWNGKSYVGEWREVIGDHLAFLYDNATGTNGHGACSLEAGCAANRAAMHFVAAESIELLPESLPTLAYTTLEGQSLDERIAAVNRAVQMRYPTNGSSVVPQDYAFVTQVFDDRVIVRKGDDTLSIDYTMNDGEVTLGDATKVKQVWVAAGSAAKKECDACGGTGQMKDGSKQTDCPSCDGEGYLKTAAGARHSSGDMKMIQTVHDHAAALGATCDRKNLEIAAAKPIEPQLRAAIEREGTKWVLYSTDRKRRLAMHDTEAEAKAQHEAMQAVLTKT